MLSGGLITVYGHYVPFLFAGAILATIGTGLIYTLDIGSPSGHWIGYQTLAGVGIGLSIQVPIIANQAFVSMSEISSVTAITLCKCSSLQCSVARFSNPMKQSSRLLVALSSSPHVRLPSQIDFLRKSLSLYLALALLWSLQLELHS